MYFLLIILGRTFRIGLRFILFLLTLSFPLPCDVIGSNAMTFVLATLSGLSTIRGFLWWHFTGADLPTTHSSQRLWPPAWRTTWTHLLAANCTALFPMLFLRLCLKAPLSLSLWNCHKCDQGLKTGFGLFLRHTFLCNPWRSMGLFRCCQVLHAQLNFFLITTVSL